MKKFSISNIAGRQVAQDDGKGLRFMVLADPDAEAQVLRHLGEAKGDVHFFDINIALSAAAGRIDWGANADVSDLRRELQDRAEELGLHYGASIWFFDSSGLYDWASEVFVGEAVAA